MGAFFLYQSDIKLNLPAVEALFRAKGFSLPPVRQHFGVWTLMHYRKQLLPEETMSVSNGIVTLVATGTFSYMGNGLRQSLKQVLADYQANRLVEDSFVGAYSLLFCTAQSITVLSDRLNLLHVFTNQQQTVFSSSFAAVLKAGPQKFKLNVPAVIENALAGYIIGPETIVHGIHQVDERYRARSIHAGITFQRHNLQELHTAPSVRGDFETCVKDQIDELDRWFIQLKRLVDEAGGVDIGLSGGYDSRLLVLMATRHFNKVTAHSHFHRQITRDESVAQEIARFLAVPLNRFEASKQPAEMDVEEFERNLESAAPFSDMRVVHDYSWLNFFRTRWYRELVLKDVRFAMNGLGGELYRNHDNQVYRVNEPRAWLKARILGPGVFSAIGPKALDDSMDHILAKASTALGQPLGRQISHHQMRRYFGELFSVYGAAVRLNADNQIAFSLSPYLDYQLRRASYRVLPQLGLAGRVEREMIKRLDKGVAAIPSAYGYRLDRLEPGLRLLKCGIRGLVPYCVQNSVNMVRLHGARRPSPVYEALFRRQPLVRQAAELMRSQRFGLIWSRTVQNDVLMQRVLSIGIMLLKNEDSIDLSS